MSKGLYDFRKRTIPHVVKEGLLSDQFLRWFESRVRAMCNPKDIAQLRPHQPL